MTSSNATILNEKKRESRLSSASHTFKKGLAQRHLHVGVVFCGFDCDCDEELTSANIDLGGETPELLAWLVTVFVNNVCGFKLLLH
jgi:hypothetical protein